MIGPNQRIGGIVIFLAAAVSLSFAFPAIPGISHSQPLTCEGKFKDAEKLILNETSLDVGIRKLINNYTGWGEYLDSAPLAISGMGKLVIMSEQHRREFHKDKSPRNKLFAFHNYPKSYRTSLLQISRQGNLAFIKAHRNMAEIRTYNSANVLHRHIKVATRYLMSRNQTYYINQSMSILMSIFYDAALTSKSLANEVVKEFKDVLESIDQMIITTHKMELRRRKTQQVVKRNKSLHSTKLYYKETIKSLQTASNELGKLRTSLTQLVTFYTKMSVFITNATLESVVLIYAIARHSNRKLDDKEIFEKVQKAIEASFLVHEVADMYVDVSGMYIKDQIGNLENMIKYLDLMELKHGELKWSTKSDSEGIRHFIEADEILLREKLVNRHNQIVNEYRWMEDCDSPEDRQFQNEEE